MTITINMAKARDIHRDILRRVRDEKLVAADIAYMQADEAGDAARKAAIAAFKQQLRDMPNDPAITAASTPDDLKNVRPAILDQPSP